MTVESQEPFFCLWIHDLLASTFDPESRVSTWGQLRLKKVDILGTVVAARTYEKRSEYEVDDGTGVIHVCWFHREPAPSAATAVARPAEPPLARLPLGTRLHVRGGLQEYRERKQVVAYSLRVVTDPSEPCARVFRQAALYRQVYAAGR